MQLNREEFVSVIEGFVMDHEEESDDADDFRAPAQRRHLNTIAGDVQEQVTKVSKGRSLRMCRSAACVYSCNTDGEGSPDEPDAQIPRSHATRR